MYILRMLNIDMSQINDDVTENLKTKMKCTMYVTQIKNTVTNIFKECPTN